MYPILDDLISKILSELFTSSKENKIYWSDVYSDKDHELYTIVNHLRQENKLSSDSGITILKSSIIPMIISLAQKDQNNLYLNLSLKKNDDLLKDILSPQSNILHYLVEILSIQIVFYSNSPIIFNPIKSPKRPGRPLSLRWSRSTNTFVIIDHKIQTNSRYGVTNAAPSSSAFNQNNGCKKRKIDMSRHDNEKRLKQIKESCSSDMSSDDSNDDISITQNLKEKNADTFSDFDDVSVLDPENTTNPKMKIENLSDSSDDENEALLKRIISSPVVENLKAFNPSSVLYDSNNLEEAQLNCKYIMEALEKMRRQVQLIQKNILPEALENCKFCAIHCGRAVNSKVKDKRGPKEKSSCKKKAQ